MGLSINPLSLLEVFFDRQDRNSDHVADFLDEVAEEAKALAEIWDRVIEDLSSQTGKFKPDSNTLEILRRYEGFNAGPFFRLREFYNCFSATMQVGWTQALIKRKRPPKNGWPLTLESIGLYCFS